MRPKIFVASSKEAERIALAVQQNLEESADVTVWTQDAFQVGRVIIDELIRNLQSSHFGVFVFAPDDIVLIRGAKQKTARDNVIFELGMFIGRLGKDRSFVIKPKGEQMRLPTDLLGVVTGEFDGKRTDNFKAATGSVCIQILDAVKQHIDKRPKILNQLVENALETVCRALSVPVTPERATLRAFIFRKEGKELVCRHFWDPNPSDEEIGKTRFEINKRTSSRVVVVRCFLDNATRRSESPEVESSKVQPLPKHFKGAKGKIKQSLNYVLAAPIQNDDGSLWGVVDFDASNFRGKSLLQTKVSNTVMVRLARHLSAVLS